MKFNFNIYFLFLLLQIFGEYYHFEHRKISKRSIDAAHEHHKLLETDDRVFWAKQQKVKSRQKRDYKPAKGKARVNTNDPNWPQMWYLVS